MYWKVLNPNKISYTTWDIAQDLPGPGLRTTSGSTSSGISLFTGTLNKSGKQKQIRESLLYSFWNPAPILETFLKTLKIINIYGIASKSASKKIRNDNAIQRVRSVHLIFELEKLQIYNFNR